ncbi:hypothetical protein FRX31_013765 [Thalictrum thalictroides]|uniref:Uncharacterized protein n=1 Tax=Thalictrum thalictroides TaxID=46969 RepID=A0A7J6WGT0_THATH|nr:hypothetical protein FRX31_013765 [Thalictrum thalictroides]
MAAAIEVLNRSTVTAMIKTFLVTVFVVLTCARTGVKSQEELGCYTQCGLQMCKCLQKCTMKGQQMANCKSFCIEDNLQCIINCTPPGTMTNHSPAPPQPQSQTQQSQTKIPHIQCSKWEFIN